jgi:rSAM/selenodomain-associated transferase 1
LIYEYAIVIMAKAPLPDQVKTRMIPSLDPWTVSNLYHNFLLDKIEQVKNVEAQAFIAYTPETEFDFFRSIVPPGFNLINQVGADLGERLANISKRLFVLGFKKVLILDSDTPNLPVEYIKKGLEQLDNNDVVIGPCEDGGYYMIGLKADQPHLFRDIPWSTSRVTELTMNKAQSSGLIVSILAKWYDIDTLEDLLRLKNEMDLLSNNRKTSFLCENTRNAISKMNI